MGPPGGGRNEISRRIQTKLLMINFTFPSESQVRRIFQNILSHKFLTQDFDDEIKQISETLAYATINLYNAIA
jgi:dynein heavy chain